MDYEMPPASHWESHSTARYKPPLQNDISIPFLKNFEKEAPDLYRSAFPFPPQLIELGENGINVVINFELLPDLPLPGGPEHLIHIPAVGNDPTPDEVVDFLQVINYIRGLEAAGGEYKILVHCVFGRDRTGLMIAAYQRVFEGKDLATVEAEYAHFGHTDFRYLEEILGTPEQVAAFREAAQLPPKDKYIQSFYFM